MATLTTEEHESQPDKLMSGELHDKLLAAGVPVPDECVSFEIVANVGEIVSVVWRCYATRDLLAALGKP